MLKLIKIVAFLFVLIEGIYTLKCLSCSSHYDQCGAEVNNLNRVAQEKCSSRCFIRTDERGILTRGCDAGYYFTEDEKIPDNGCGFKNTEYWCWCTNSDLCNLKAPKKLFTFDFRNPINNSSESEKSSGNNGESTDKTDDVSDVDKKDSLLR